MGWGFFGWRVTFAMFWTGVFAWGFGFYGLGVYLTELRAAHGWSTTIISTAASFYYLFGALLVANVARVFRRFGPRPTMLVGIAAMGSAVSVLPLLTAPWQLFAAYAVMAVGWATMSLAAINTTLAPWFVRRRGLAISLALTGASGGGVLVAPLLVWASARWSFQTAAWGMVIAMFALLLPMLAFFVRTSPDEMGEHPDGERGSAPPSASAVAQNSAAVPTAAALLRTYAFWSIALPFAAALFAQVGFLVHQIAMLKDRLGAGGAAIAVAITTTAAIVGRLGLGLVVDKLNHRQISAASLASQAGAIALLIVFDEPLILYTACALFGLSVGNLITLPSLVIQREFDFAAFSVVVALVTATCQVTYAFGPATIGLARDLTGDYTVALGLCIAVQLLAAVLVLRPSRG